VSGDGLELGLSARLLGDIAHVARNHITIIQSYLEMLHAETGDELNDDQLAFLGAAYDNVLQLGSMIEDLVLIGALETGIAELEWEIVDLGPLIEEIVRDLEPRARGEGLQIRCELEIEGGAVRADRCRLADAVRRLIDNAIRFTPQGGTVEVSTRHAKDRIEISVADTGVGMSVDELARSFELMTQLHRQPGEPRRGHGLGLPAARHIAAALGGRLSADSRAGSGSTFTIELPAAEPAGSR
jgi:signal transduction histidine kinase